MNRKTKDKRCEQKSVTLVSRSAALRIGSLPAGEAETRRAIISTCAYGLWVVDSQGGSRCEKLKIKAEEGSVLEKSNERIPSRQSGKMQFHVSVTFGVGLFVRTASARSVGKTKSCSCDAKSQNFVGKRKTSGKAMMRRLCIEEGAVSIEPDPRLHCHAHLAFACAKRGFQLGELGKLVCSTWLPVAGN